MQTQRRNNGVGKSAKANRKLDQALETLQIPPSQFFNLLQEGPDEVICLSFE